MTLCMACCQSTAAFCACMWCGHRLRETGDQRAGKAVLHDVAARLDELTRTARQETTLKRHNAEMAAYTEFCRAKLQLQPFNTTPLHILAYLISCDKNGKTTVHTDGCPLARPSAGAGDQQDQPQCLGHCPTRLKASSVRGKVASLRAAFEEMGCTIDWAGGHQPSENPCNARIVDVYVAGVAKEQLHAGVATRTAPLFDRDVFVGSVRALLRLCNDAHRDGDCEGAWWYLQGAAMLSLLFFYPDRSHNLAELRWGDIKQIAAATLADGSARAAYASITIRLSKSVAASMQERVALVPDADDGADYSPVLLLHQLHASVRSLVHVAPAEMATWHVFVPQGAPGRRASKLKDASTTAIGTPAMQQVLETALIHAGFKEAADDITLHSFRASGARDALMRGEPEDIILAQYHWRSPDMLVYYTELRTLWTKQGAQRASTVQRPAKPDLAMPSTSSTTPLVTRAATHLPPGIPRTVAEGQKLWKPQAAVTQATAMTAAKPMQQHPASAARGTATDKVTMPVSGKSRASTGKKRGAPGHGQRVSSRLQGKEPSPVPAHVPGTVVNHSTQKTRGRKRRATSVPAATVTAVTTTQPEQSIPPQLRVQDDLDTLGESIPRASPDVGAPGMMLGTPQTTLAASAPSLAHIVWRAAAHATPLQRNGTGTRAPTLAECGATTTVHLPAQATTPLAPGAVGALAGIVWRAAIHCRQPASAATSVPDVGPPRRVDSGTARMLSTPQCQGDTATPAAAPTTRTPMPSWSERSRITAWARVENPTRPLRETFVDLTGDDTVTPRTGIERQPRPHHPGGP
jgi:hypothetical protein